MSRRVRRRQFQRIVIWQPATGSIINIPSRFVLAGSAPSESEEYAQLASGSKTPVRRTNRVQIPLTHKELALFGEVIQRSKCPVKAAFISANEGDNWLWLEETRLQITDPEVSAGENVPKVIDLENKVFYPGIWESNDLLGGIPWQDTSGYKQEELDGNPIRLEPTGEPRKGYLGPAWEVDSESDTVDLAGNANLSTEAKARFQFPVWGAKLRIEALLGYSLSGAVISALDYSESVIETSGFLFEERELVLPEGTFYVEARVSNSNVRPKLVVSNVGISNGVVYTGGVSPDCQPVKDPDWEELPKPNEPPEWKKKEDLVYGLNNTPPNFTKCGDYTVVETNTGGDNSPPNFTKCENYTVTEEKTGGKDEGTFYIPPEVGQTRYIFTANGGFSIFGYVPDETNYNNYLDVDNAFDLAADYDADRVFLARDGDITRWNQDGTNKTTLLSESANFVGIALDPFNSNVYYSYQNQDGIYKLNYDGSGKTQHISDAGQNYALAVAPDAGDGGTGGHIFAISKQEDELLRFDLDGSGKSVLKDFSNILASPQRNVHLHLPKSYVYYQQSESSNRRNVRRINFDGTNDVGIFLQVSSITVNDRKYWTILQDENGRIELEEVEGGTATVEIEDLTGSTTQVTSVSSVDTGAYLASAQSMSQNTSPTFTSDDNYTYAK